MNNVADLARKLRLFFEAHHKEIEIPFFYNFPNNSCEGASFFFGNIAQEIFPDETFEIIKGQRADEPKEEYHYWVESNGFIYDLTSDQFKYCSSPVFGEKAKARHLGFNITERHFISCYLPFYTGNCMDFEKFTSIKRLIVEALFK